MVSVFILNLCIYDARELQISEHRDPFLMEHTVPKTLFMYKCFTLLKIDIERAELKTLPQWIEVKLAYAEHYSLLTVNCTLYTVHFIQYTVKFTLYTVHCEYPTYLNVFFLIFFFVEWCIF